MGPTSRLRVDPSTNLPGITSFGELSQFLRGAVADEESRQLSESMAHLAGQIEAILALLGQGRERVRVAPPLMDLLGNLRTHRQMVVHLGPPWRKLYEYPSYLHALNNFRALVSQWLVEGGADTPELALTAEDFQLVAWRALGEGILLIDMYEQRATRGDAPESSSMGELAPDGVQRAVQWWRRLRL